MPFVTRRALSTLSLLAIIAAVLFGGFVWSGIYNIAADDPHTPPVSALMEAMRDRSIAARTADLDVPDLRDPARIAQGAGNYDAMCTGCHLAPGIAETELSKGLYPAPPNLTRESVPTREAFWAIKHGIKASGMPAWGKSMNDEYIWNMVAFLQQLPKLDADAYRDMVAHSEGHSHGGGEGAHHHDDNDDHEAEEAHAEQHAHQMPASASTVPEHGKPGHHH